MKNLSAQNLKTALWETLSELRAGTKQPAEADAIASQSREILRTTNTQLRIASQSGRNIPLEVIEFSEK